MSSEKIATDEATVLNSGNRQEALFIFYSVRVTRNKTEIFRPRNKTLTHCTTPTESQIKIVQTFCRQAKQRSKQHGKNTVYPRTTHKAKLSM
jgi:hypothetical protein